MNFGKLRHSVLFQSRTPTQDASGQQMPGVWVDVVTVRAEVRGLTGRALEAGQAQHPDVSYTIRVRYQSVFSDPKAVAAMRAVYKGRNFDLHASINPDERDREILIYASEGVNNG